MRSVMLHANDAAAFINKYGQPKLTENGPASTTMQYDELDDEAVELAKELSEVRRISGDPSRDLLIFDAEAEELTIDRSFVIPELESPDESEIVYNEPEVDEDKKVKRDKPSKKTATKKSKKKSKR